MPRPPADPPATTLPTTKAARVLGVHPNTLRAWADQGRIRCLRLNARGDRRFLVEDLEAFLQSAEVPADGFADPDPTGTVDDEAAAPLDAEAQIDSIAKIGTRLTHLGTVDEIGAAICLELRQIIDYHNVRVYRVVGDDVVPVAWRGEISTYLGEAGESLRLKVGEGITGWVARHGVPQYLPDAAADPRGSHVPGTEKDLAESMLLAPMLYEDDVVGVIVLSKLGLDRFSPRDLRYLGIYASIAAQAMANADIAARLRAQEERLDRELRSQRELLRVTERVLTMLDPAAVVAEIADSLAGLIPVDTLGIAIHEPGSGSLDPLLARGIGAHTFMERPQPDDDGVAAEVLVDGEARNVQRTDGPPAAMVIAPLRGRERVLGVLHLERLGPDARFDQREFDLVRLFAAHVSIALQNALAHRAVELRAQTDALTGLRNMGTFRDDLADHIAGGRPFALMMLDLDDFKVFNDTRGHGAGNELLIGISRAIERACRQADRVYRYGGDEFCVLLDGASVAEAVDVADRIRRAINGVPGADGRPSEMRCSVGVATYPDDADSGAQLLLAADRALYAAKRAGRNRIGTAEDGLTLAADVVLPHTPVDQVPVA